MTYIEKLESSEWIEIEAVREGVVWARDRGFTLAIIESDNANASNRLKVRKVDITTLGHYLHTVKNLVINLPNFNFKWNGKEGNKATDRLSVLTLQNKCNLIFDMDYLQDIHNFVMDDLV